MRTYVIITAAMFCLATFLLSCQTATSKSKKRGEVERVSPQEARQKAKSGKALLVCAYDDATCSDMVLDGSLLRSEFESRLSSLSKDQEIIFYCA